MERPDLEEFLSALNGFIDKKSASTDSSFLKFLDIFCRSVGSTEGHFLRPSESGTLESFSSFGVAAGFDAAFNAARQGTESSPLDQAFKDSRVVAMVEVKNSDVPAWFYRFMERQGFKSLVAVPIIGHRGPTGLLCAYYRDICLFDQGTLDRLSALGRMVGGAAEGPAKAEARERPVPAGAAGGDAAADEFVHTLTEKPFTKIQAFSLLVAAAGRAVPGAVVICGPVRISSGEMVITVADGAGVPTATVSHRFSLPTEIRRKLVTGEGMNGTRAMSISPGDLGDFGRLVKVPHPVFICQPVMWQGKMQAAVIAWRQGGAPLTESDDHRLGRLAAIAALALNAA